MSFLVFLFRCVYGVWLVLVYIGDGVRGICVSIMIMVVEVDDGDVLDGVLEGILGMVMVLCC